MILGRDSGLIMVMRAGDVSEVDGELFLCGERVEPDLEVTEADWFKERREGTRAFELTYWRKYHSLANYIDGLVGLKQQDSEADVELPQLEKILEFIQLQLRHNFDEDWDCDDYWDASSRVMVYGWNIAALGWYIEFARRHPNSVSVKFYDSW